MFRVTIILCAVCAVFLLSCQQEDVSDSATPSQPVKQVQPAPPAPAPQPPKVTGPQLPTSNQPTPQPKGVYQTPGVPIAAPVDYIGAVGQTGNIAKYKAQLLPVSQAINQFRSVEGRAPANLQELISNGYLRALPDIPGGMQIIYNAAQGAVTLAPR